MEQVGRRLAPGFAAGRARNDRVPGTDGNRLGRSAMRTLTSRLLARVQGAFYLLTGIWPILAGTSFQQVTGFKVDFWIAQLVGALLACLGATLFLSARTGGPVRELQYLAAGTALILGIFDLVCVPLPHTTRVYGIDAMVEFALVIAWLEIWRKPAP